MAKSKTELEVKKVSALAIPDFMQGTEHLGTEDLGQFIVPPRLKVVQKQSGDAFSEFDPGDVIAVPQMILVSPIKKDDRGRGLPEGEPFFFTPIFFFPEWCLWNPLETKGTLPAIRERTTDPKSPIAVKSKNQATWFEPCPESPEHECRYVEHLNFVVVLRGEHEMAGIPVVMSFSRSEHRYGSSFAALLKMRKAPIFGCQFQAQVGYRTNAKGQWHGIAVTNPAGETGITPFIQDEQTFRLYEGLHKEMKLAYEAGKVQVDYDDVVEPEPTDAKGEF